MATVLVTGGDGFIGRRLVALLRSRGDEVRILEAKPAGGVRSPVAVREAVAGPVETVYHLGAVSGYPFFARLGTAMGIITNCLGAYHVLAEAVKAGVRRVVLVSTMSCYAGAPLPHRENGPVTCPNPYVATKLFAERMARLYWETAGLQTVIVRLSSVYGIGEETKGPVANPVTLFVQAAVRGEAPVLFGDGTQTRDLLYVDDAARGIARAGDPAGGALPGQTYNISTGKETTYNLAVQVIGEHLGREVLPEYRPWKGLGQQRDYITRQRATHGRFTRATGWRPRVDVGEGLRRVVLWTRDGTDTPIEADA